MNRYVEAWLNIFDGDFLITINVTITLLFPEILNFLSQLGDWLFYLLCFFMKNFGLFVFAFFSGILRAKCIANENWDSIFLMENYFYFRSHCRKFFLHIQAASNWVTLVAGWNTLKCTKSYMLSFFPVRHFQTYYSVVTYDLSF